MAIAVFLLGAATTIAGIRNVLTAWAMQRWPAVQGEVRSSSVLRVRSLAGLSSEGRYYRPEIVYAFKVGGTEYTGVRRTLFAIQFGGPDYPAKVVARYPVGQRVMIYYDPRNPRHSIMSRESALPLAASVALVGTGFCAATIRWFFR
jgi:hypothetical protein